MRQNKKKQVGMLKLLNYFNKSFLNKIATQGSETKDLEIDVLDSANLIVMFKILINCNKQDVLDKYSLVYIDIFKNNVNADMSSFKRRFIIDMAKCQKTFVALIEAVEAIKTILRFLQVIIKLLIMLRICLLLNKRIRNRTVLKYFL